MLDELEIALVILAVLLVGYILAQRSESNVDELRRSGQFPQEGLETPADIDRLLQLGHKIEAIKVYRAIHRVGLREAKEAVERRQQEIGLS